MLMYIKDEQPEVRQAAVYGCGVLGQVKFVIVLIIGIIQLFILQFGGAQFASVCAQVIPTLVELVIAPGSREPENVNPTENAISAITKILKFNATAVLNRDEIIAMWLVFLFNIIIFHFIPTNLTSDKI